MEVHITELDPSWSKPQVAARSHPNVVVAQKWLNKFWYPSSTEGDQGFMKGVDLDQPLSYADRFRIRNADKNDKWTFLGPHIDSKHPCITGTSFPKGRALTHSPPGGSMERWEDTTMRKCFNSILQGDWKSQYVICRTFLCGLLNCSSDPFTLDGRVGPLTDLDGKPGQCKVWRTWQGWLSMRCVPMSSIIGA
jgi:hypothetical protein